MACELLTGSIPEPRVAKLKTIRDRNKQFVDTALVLYFPGPHSFTGEDCLEIQCHGGRAVVSRILQILSEMPHLRQATAGEFTKRAFESGKLDLVEAEGLADLITAETEMQRRLAAEQSSGGLSRLYDTWAKRITHARAMIEAEIDFADEDDVPGSVSQQVWHDMESLLQELTDHLDGAEAAEIIRDGLKVVIMGEPNVGKSSLINALVKRDVAIVTDIPGTTRDILTADMDINGYAVRFYDTAGLRQSDDVVEREGIRRAQLAAAEADLVLFLRDLSVPPRPESGLPEVPVLRVGTKADLAFDKDWEGQVDVRISSPTGAGLNDLTRLLSDHLNRLTHSSMALPTRQRHVQNLEEARKALGDACFNSNSGLDLRAEQLRVAAVSLGRITGSVDVEDLLDRIFSQFCIGK